MSSQGAAMPPTPSVINTAIITLAVVFPVVDTLAVGLRFYLRHGKKQGLRADDWTILVALIVAWGLAINTYVIAGMGGVNTSFLDPVTALKVFTRGVYVSWAFLVTVLGLTKISALLFYCRIFTTRPFLIAAYSTIAVIAVYTLIAMLLGCFITTPVDDIWTNPTPHYTFDNADFYLAISGINIGFDLLVICFPLPVIGRLRLTLSRKLQVASVFLIASFCLVASVLRFYFSFASDKLALSSTAEDKFLLAQVAFVWTHIEPFVSVLAVCLPTYGAFLYKANGQGIGTLVGYFRSALSVMSGSRTSSKAGTTGHSPVATNEGHGKTSGSLSNASTDSKLKNHVDEHELDTLRQSDIETGPDYRNPQAIHVRRDIQVEQSYAS